MNLPSASGRGPSRTASMAVRIVTLAALASAAAACQSSPAAHSGYLSTYAGLGDKDGGRKTSAKRRDDAMSGAVKRVYIEPAALRMHADSPIKPDQQAMVQSEVDRRICFEVSKYFDVAPSPEPSAGVVRTAIVRIDPTSMAGSAATAAAGFFNPIPMPMINLRAPMTTGGLSAESELLTPDGQQAAALIWSYNAEVISRSSPSLSPVGDALQMAEPFGKAVAKTFAVKAKTSDGKKAKKRKVPDPDPCARYGSRRNVTRFVGSTAMGIATGLYSPTVAGTGRPAEPQSTPQGDAPRP